MVKTINPMFEDSEVKLIKKAKGKLSYREWMVQKAKEDLNK